MEMEMRGFGYALLPFDELQDLIGFFFDFVPGDVHGGFYPGKIFFSGGFLGVSGVMAAEMGGDGEADRWWWWTCLWRRNRKKKEGKKEEIEDEEEEVATADGGFVNDERIRKKKKKRMRSWKIKENPSRRLNCFIFTSVICFDLLPRKITNYRAPPENRYLRCLLCFDIRRKRRNGKFSLLNQNCGERLITIIAEALSSSSLRVRQHPTTSPTLNIFFFLEAESGILCYQQFNRKNFNK